MNKRIIKKVYQNKDDYSWKEVNCFVKSFSIAVATKYPGEYKNIILYFNYLYRYSWRWKNDLQRDEEVVNKVNVVEDDLISINYIENRNYEKWLNEITRLIDGGYLVIVPSDIIELYYNPGYKITHDNHYFIIRGYDLDKNLFYIVDNMHLKNGSSVNFEGFTIPIHMVIVLTKEYFKNKQFTNELFFWSVNLKNSSKIIREDGYLSVVKDKIRDYLKLDNQTKKEIITSFFVDKNKRKIIFELHNYNYFFLKQIITTEKITKSMQIKIDDFLNLEEKIFIGIVMNKKIDTKSWKGFFDKESIILEEISKLMVMGKLTYPKDESVLNRNRVSLKLESEELKIIHTNKYTTDIWNEEDNAFQILPEIKEKSFVIEIAINNNSLCGQSFHNGIIVKNEDTVLLFGSHKKEEISLFDPSMGEDFNIKSIPYQNDELILKLEVDKDNLIFSYFDFVNDHYEFFFKTTFSNHRFKAGFFSKTWEFINHETYLRYFKINNNLVDLKEMIKKYGESSFK